MMTNNTILFSCGLFSRMIVLRFLILFVPVIPIALIVVFINCILYFHWYYANDYSTVLLFAVGGTVVLLAYLIYLFYTSVSQLNTKLIAGEKALIREWHTLGKKIDCIFYENISQVDFKQNFLMRIMNAATVSISTIDLAKKKYTLKPLKKDDAMKLYDLLNQKIITANKVLKESPHSDSLAESTVFQITPSKKSMVEIMDSYVLVLAAILFYIAVKFPFLFVHYKIILTTIIIFLIIGYQISLLYLRTKKYVFTTTKCTIHCASLLYAQIRILPYSNITDFSLRQSVFDYLLGLAKIQLYTQSDDDFQSPCLNGIPLEEAERIYAYLFAFHVTK